MTKRDTKAASDYLDEVEALRIDVSAALPESERVRLGQFFTPRAVADLIASHCDLKRDHLDVLDPGAGVGSLTASLVARVLSDGDPATTVHGTTFEVDSSLEAPLSRTLGLLSDAGEGRFAFTQRSGDFLEWAVERICGSIFESSAEGSYDLVVMNPPYRKINSLSRERKLLASAGIETTNLYTAFLSTAQRLVKPGGQIVAITPRSFFNGTYFRDFRRSFLNEFGLQGIHVFESREVAFAGDAVLQENVIFSAIKGQRPETVELTTSYGLDDDMHVVRVVPREEVVRPEDPEFFIHVAVDESQAEIARRMQSLPCGLSDLGIQVSTGRVVDFRAREWLTDAKTPSTVPLIYQAHIRSGGIEWPLSSFRKPQHIANEPVIAKQLMPDGHYVLTKRFTAKEERRRVSAGVLETGALSADAIGFENHTNVFHSAGAGLPSLEFAYGLSAFLNSTFVDQYFRQFSGHTQVNCGDLRSLRYPSKVELAALGAAMGPTLPEQEKIDVLVAQHVAALGGDGESPMQGQNKIAEALAVLRELDMPREQLNDRSALTLLAALNLGPEDAWRSAAAPLIGITPMMTFFAERYGKTYKPNTRETVRRQTVHQFVDAGILVYNPDKPDRPVNSPKAVYQVDQKALLLFQKFGTAEWDAALAEYRKEVVSLRERHAAVRAMARIPVTLSDGSELTLSPGGQNILIKELVEGFCPRFVPGGKVLYVGDADEKWAVNDEASFAALGLGFDKHGKMPDLVVYDEERGWLVLVEAVTSHGPVNAKRHEELKELFKGSTAGLVYVTAFLTRSAFAQYVTEISWETEVWTADHPTHLVHFNGTRFLGPYEQ